MNLTHDDLPAQLCSLNNILINTDCCMYQYQEKCTKMLQFLHPLFYKRIKISIQANVLFMSAFAFLSVVKLATLITSAIINGNAFSTPTI